MDNFEDAVLHKPTVADMIRQLAKYPPNMLLTLEDADTSWTIDVIHFSAAGGEVSLFGSYDEMNKS